MSGKRAKAERAAEVLQHPFRAVRKAGVPLVAYETGDPWATVAGCMRSFLNGLAGATPCFQWDCIRGLRPLNESANQRQAQTGPQPGETAFLAQCLGMLNEPQEGGAANQDDKIKLAPGAVVFLLNAQRWLDDPSVVQGLCNLRNPAKGIGATLVLVGPAFTLPPEIRDDTITIDEPPPTSEQLGRIITGTVTDIKAAAREAGIEFPDPDVDKVKDTLTGYRSEFQTEQSLALAVTPQGVNMDTLWERRVAALRGTAGLEISKPKETFADLAGCAGTKWLLGRILGGKRRVKGILQMDELNRMISGGGGGDLSGTTDAMIEQWLFWTTEKRIRAVLSIGVPGAGKSATCKCAAGQAGVPLLRASMSTVKGSLVGQSESQMKSLLQSISSICDDEVVMIATCNEFDALSPEIIARFREAVIVYDFPDAEENAALWALYRAKFGIPSGQENPPSRNWVGREIESCCDKASEWDCTLAEAAESVVPLCVASRTKIDALRQSLSGRFLSAAHRGPYEYRPADGAFAATVETTTKRKITL